MEDLGPFYQDVIAVDPLEPYGPASAAYRLELLTPTLPFRVSGARLVPSNNNDVWRLDVGYLRVAWRGDRRRLAREAGLLGRLRGVVPVPEVLDCGGDDRLTWSLTTSVPGTAYEELCVPSAGGWLRDLAREVATLLRELHSWPVPADVAEMLRRPEADSDALRLAGAELVPPPWSALELIPLAGQLPFVDRGVLDAAAERLTALASLTTANGEVLLHGDFYLGNILVHGGHVSALTDFEFARLGPPDLELISVVRALDAERRLGLRRPPLLVWLAADYRTCSPPLTWTAASGSTPSPTPSATSSSGHPIAPKPTAWTRPIRCTRCAAWSTPPCRANPAPTASPGPAVTMASVPHIGRDRPVSCPILSQFWSDVRAPCHCAAWSDRRHVNYCWP